MAGEIRNRQSRKLEGEGASATPSISEFLSIQIVVPPPANERNTEPGWPHVDIAGFSIAYGAGCALALHYRRRLPWLSRTFLASIAVFLLHLPLLPFAPRLAGGLMEFSVCLCVSLPLLLAALAYPKVAT